MKQQIKQRLIVFFSSILLMLPISNTLHFVLIDHSITQDFGIENVPHQCDDFILYQTYVINEFNTEIKAPIWLDFNYKSNINYYQFFQSKFIVDINNKGPPSLNFI